MNIKKDLARIKSALNATTLSLAEDNVFNIILNPLVVVKTSKEVDNGKDLIYFALQDLNETSDNFIQSFKNYMNINNFSTDDIEFVALLATSKTLDVVKFIENGDPEFIQFLEENNIDSEIFKGEGAFSDKGVLTGVSREVAKVLMDKFSTFKFILFSVSLQDEQFSIHYAELTDKKNINSLGQLVSTGWGEVEDFEEGAVENSIDKIEQLPPIFQNLVKSLTK